MRTMMRNCASENLEIPDSRFARSGMTNPQSSRDDASLNLARRASRQELPLDLGGW
jgi:hypothetical protein